MKLTWQERSKTTERIHKEHLIENKNWRVQDTAEELDRSLGRISEDLTLADWMRTHKEVEQFSTAQEALEFIRKKKLEIRTRL